MLEKIKEILENELGISAPDLTEETSFRDDLGVDSLDLFELVTNLEDKYQFEIPVEKLDSMKTVKDVIRYMEDNGIEV